MSHSFNLDFNILYTENKGDKLNLWEALQTKTTNLMLMTHRIIQFIFFGKT